ncbi:MAG TPA: type II secretion system minor pseudopilin GspK [Burkholderiaceae bacterium]|nr:type II secretion system minor pseudopilin GspK [Burkholderiaceae bacterium]
MSCHRTPATKPRQTGAALLAAMLTVTLVATFAAAALWQNWRSVEVEAAERARVQAGWVLTGALDWARLILREDARSGGADHLAEPWAVPLQEARLSSFLAADKSNVGGAEEALDAFLSGQITDLQSRLNVLNLVENGKISEPSFAAFNKLFGLLGLPPAQLQALVENLRQASDNGTGSQAPLLPQRVGQLAWLGLSPASIAVLEPYVTLLPARTGVNLNTASAEVICASLPAMEMADAQRMVAARTRTHFRSLTDAASAAGLSGSLFSEGNHTVASRFFEVLGTLRMEQTLVEERSVVQRDGLNVTTLWRERVARAPAVTQTSGARP